MGFSEGSWLSLARVHLANYDSRNAAPANWTRACKGPKLLYVEFCLRAYRLRHDVRFLSEAACQQFHGSPLPRKTGQHKRDPGGNQSTGGRGRCRNRGGGRR